MTPERFRQVRNLFDAALDREAAERPAFLEEACRGDEPLREEVGRLLAAHDRETAIVDRPVVRPEVLTGDPGRMEGRRIDHYEILRELGHGGMGSVYLAVRTDDVYRKQVAFKVVRPEASSREVIERFRQERQILAALDHPSLARLLDGGTTPEGLPYFVMDYVDGKPIDSHCDERQLNIADRLTLFRSVCSAVEYLHRHGVVHRDLKPANLLVTAEGVVKLLDFGIAKLVRAGDADVMAQVTRTGMRLMTPEYASPEQVRGERVGVASDVYALGVVLYELLTGHRPYRMSNRLIHEIVRVICEDEPTRPSTAVTQVEQRLVGEGDTPVSVTPQTVSRTRAASPAGLRRQLAGDPDKILLKALRKVPAERYRTVKEFDEDLRRHLEGLPVLAQDQGVVVRAGKWLQRHPLWTLPVLVLAIGVLSGTVKISIGPALVMVLTVLAFMLPSFFVAYRWLRTELGRNLASRRMLDCAVWFALFVSLAFAVERFGAEKLLSIDFVRQGLGVLTVASAVCLGTLLARWPLRARWAGPLLLDISRPRPRWVDMAMGTTWALLFAITVTNITVTVISIASEIVVGLTFVITLVTSSRTEFRQHGIVCQGMLLRWRNIEAYTWEPAGGGLVALTVRPIRLSPPFFRLRVVLPAEQKGAMEAILGQQLSEWPG